MTIEISEVDRSFQPKAPSYATDLASPRHGYHWLRVVATYQVEAGRHDLEPFALFVQDEVGQEFADPLIGADDSRCEPGPGGLFGAGESLGPFGLCYQVADPTGTALSLNWYPTEQPGSGLLTVALP